MFKWIKSHTHNRRARLVIDNKRSKKIILRHGVPQGGILSPHALYSIHERLGKTATHFLSRVPCKQMN